MSDKRNFALAAIVVSVFPVAQHVQAQQSTSEPSTVEVKGTTDMVRKSDTASRTVVKREELVKFGDRSILDAMKRLPGLTVKDDSVRMRGLGNGYTQILVDGQRPPAGFSLETLAPDAIEKIEIMRAATAEYSTEAIAGTVNIVLRKAVTNDSGEAKVSLGHGPGVRSPGLNLNYSGKRDGFGYTLGADASHSDSTFSSSSVDSAFAPGGGLTELRTTASKFHRLATGLNANARLNWALGKGDSLAWQVFLNDGKSHGTENNRTLTVAGPEYPYPSLDGGFFSHRVSLRSDVNLIKKLADGGKLTTNFGLYSSHIDRGLYRLGSQDSLVVFDRDMTSGIRDRGLTTTGKYVVPVVEDHAIAVGWDASLSKYRQHDIQVDAPLSASMPFNFDNGFDAAVDRLALYAQDEWDIRAGWSAYLGARWEGIRTSTTGSGFASTSARYSIFSPLMQTVWKIPGSKSDQLRLALTRTYRAPPLARLVQSHFYTSFNTQVSPDFIGNPTLRPELATGLDAAYEHYFNSGGLVSLSASSRAIQNFIRNIVSFDGERWLSSPVNQGHAQVRSLELGTKLPLKTFGSNWPVEVRANVSRNWSSVDAVPGPDNRLDDQRIWSASLGADYSSDAFSAGSSFSFVSGGWTRSSFSEFSYGGVTRDLETYLLYKLNPRQQLRFTASNLLAPDRLSVSRYADPLGELNSANTFPTYRSWRIQLEQKF